MLMILNCDPEVQFKNINTKYYNLTEPDSTKPTCLLKTNPFTTIRSLIKKFQ